MGTRSDIDVDAAAHEVFTIARCLFAFDPEQAEEGYAFRLEQDGHPEFSEQAAGRYIKFATGYIHVKEGGTEGEFLRELPEGVAPEDVTPVPFDVAGRALLQDRLRTLAEGLRSADDTGQSADALAAAVEAILAACVTTRSQAVFETVKQHAAAVLFDREPDDGGLAATGERFLAELETQLESLRAQPSAPGITLGALFAMIELTRASVSLSEASSRSVEGAFGEALGYLAAPSPLPAGEVVGGFSRRLVRDGRAAAVRTAAEKLKARGDALIEAALATSLGGFYPPLYASAAYEVAAWLIAGAAAGAESDEAAQRRWGKLAVNAEERMVRVSQSLTFGVRNLDGVLARLDRARIMQLRTTAGEEEARLAAMNRIVNELIYPRCALPILTGETPLEQDD